MKYAWWPNEMFNISMPSVLGTSLSDRPNPYECDTPAPLKTSLYRKKAPQ